MVRIVLLVMAMLWPVSGRACDLALVLAVDVSGSVSPSEYRIQRDGLAEALRDPVISEALVRARAAVTLVQWTGAGRQRVTIPWRRVTGFDALDELAASVSEDRRAWRHFSTAIGEALAFSAKLFSDVADCDDRVIDISGDGRSNEGIAPREVRPEGVVVNALVIEGEEEDLTAYFWENVIRGDGAFVVTANSFRDYPARIRQKLLQETTRSIAALEGAGRL